MNTITRSTVLGLFVAVVVSTPVAAQQPMMSFFLTSAGPGNGAALGGLEGADAYCQSRADAVEADGTWPVSYTHLRAHEP